VALCNDQVIHLEGVSCPHHSPNPTEFVSDDGTASRYELADGALVKMTPPGLEQFLQRPETKPASDFFQGEVIQKPIDFRRSPDG
jgi:hypothetical protein